MTLYLAMAVAASMLMALGLLLMKGRAAELPEARGRETVRAVLAWLRDPIWTGGLGVQTAGFAIYLVAVSNAPISMIAVMMQGGIALFVLFSVVFMGERANRREWTGISAIALAMVMLSLSLEAGAPDGRLNVTALVLLSITGLIAAFAPTLAADARNQGAAAAVAAGVLFGFGGVYTKAMADAFLAGHSASLAIRVVANPYLYLMIIANVAGIVLQQNAFRSMRGIIVMPIASALSNLVPILAGLVAFGEHLPDDPLAAAMRIGAFALTVAAGWLLATAEASPVVHVTQSASGSS
jgi:uncharacterized membrane protein